MIEIIISIVFIVPLAIFSYLCCIVSSRADDLENYEEERKMSVLSEIFDHFGYEKQRRKLVEEVMEFTDEVILYEKGLGDIDKVIDELADVELVLDQFKEVYDIKDSEIEPRKDYKKRRTLDRIERKYYE